MAFKMKSGKEGPMYKNFGVGAPTKKYGNSSNKMDHESSNKMAHESPNKQTDQELMARDKAKRDKTFKDGATSKGKTDKEANLADKIKNVVSPNKAKGADKKGVDKSSDRFKNAMANTKKKKERESKKSDLQERSSNSQRYTDKENLATDKELSSLKQTSKDIKKSVKQQTKANTKIDKNNAKITAYNNSVQDLKKFIADNTSGEVGDSTRISVPSTIQGAVTMETYEKKVKQLNKLKKKIK